MGNWESDEDGEKPKPIKMAINKKMAKKKGTKKKKRKMTDLNASDESGDGDSGSDFKLSEKEENSDFKPGTESEDSEEYDAKNRWQPVATLALSNPLSSSF